MPNNGTIIGIPTFPSVTGNDHSGGSTQVVSGSFNNVLGSISDSNYVDLSSSGISIAGTFGQGKAFSVLMRVFAPVALSGLSVAFYVGDPTATTANSMFFGANGGKLSCRMNTFAGLTATTGSIVSGGLNGTTAINDGIYHTCRLTYDGASVVSLYQDGVLVGQVSGVTTALWNPSGMTKIYIGRYGAAGFAWSTTGAFLDEVAIFNAVAAPAGGVESYSPQPAAQISQIGLYHLDNNATDSSVAAALSAFPPVMPPSRGTNYTLRLVGSSTSWVNGTTTFTITNSITGTTTATKIAQTVTSTTAATLTLTTGAGTGTFQISDGVSVIATVTVANGVILTDDAALTFSPYNWYVPSGGYGARSNNPGAYLKFLAAGTTAVTFGFDTTDNTGTLPAVLAGADGSGPTRSTLGATVVVSGLDATQKHTIDLFFAGAGTYAQTLWAANAQGALTLAYIQLDSGGTVSAVQKYPKNILVYTDSIGIGEYARSLTESTGWDASVAWPLVAGQRLGAEVGVVGFGAQGYATAVSDVPALQTSYVNLWSGQARTFSPTPDLVVLAAGINDGATGVSDPTLQAACKATWSGIATATGNSKQAICDPINTNASYYAACQASIAAAVASATTSNLTHVTTGTWYTASSSAGFGSTPWIHPNAAQHLGQIAPLATAALRPILYPTNTGVRRVALTGGISG